MNVPWILVRRRPRIAIIATGDEIVRPGELTSKNQFVSYNSYTLHAFLTALGADVQILGVAPDDTDAIGLLAKEAEGSDLLVTTGGASVGKHDLIQEALSTQKFGQHSYVMVHPEDLIRYRLVSHQEDMAYLVVGEFLI